MISKQTVTQLIAVSLTGALLFSLSMQKFFLMRFSILDRAGVGLALLLLLIVLSGVVVKRVFVPLPMVGLLLVMGISLLQLPPGSPITDYVGYVFIFVYAILLIARFGVRAAINGAVVALCLLVATNLYLAAFPSENTYVIGRLAGTFYGPNTLAASLLILIPAVTVFRMRNLNATLVIRGLLLGLALGLVYITQSRTELIAGIVFLAAWLVWVTLPHLPKLVRRLFFALVAAALSVVAVLWPSIAMVLGKNSTLSGRAELWAAYWTKIMEQPLLGYGWSVQTRVDMPLGNYILETVGTPLANAHNDYLNWWATTGIVGLLLYLLTLTMLVLASVRLRRYSNDSSQWIVLSSTVLIVNGLAELTTMFPDGWLMLSLAAGTASLQIATNAERAPRWLKRLSWNHNFTVNS